MARISVRMDEALLEQARACAAGRDTTLSRLVQELLEKELKGGITALYPVQAQRAEESQRKA